MPFPRRTLIPLSLLLGLSACGLGGGRSEDDNDDDIDLTPLEWSLVGVWRGSRPDDRWEYYVFDTDRTGCTWFREGDDFARRYDEVVFRDWALDADALNEDFRMPLQWTFQRSGEVFEGDEYDVQYDRILPGGFTELAATWIDVRIPCDGEGSNSTDSDAERWGSMGNGFTGDGDPVGTGDDPGAPGGNPKGGGGGGGGGGTSGGPSGGGGTGGPSGGGGTTGGGGTANPGPADSADSGTADTGTAPSGPQPP